jgi:plastocyanin
MGDEDMRIDLDRSQLRIGVLAGGVAYVIGFLISFLPGPIADPGVYPPRDVVNATINTTDQPRFEDSQFPLTETIDSFSSAGGVFYNAHFVDIVLLDRGFESWMVIRSNVLLAEHANGTTGYELLSQNTDLVLAGLPIPPILFFAVPVVLLAAGGFLVNDYSRETLPSPETAVASGSAVLFGYLPLVTIGAAMIRFRNPRIMFGEINLPNAILIAGITYPVLFGGLGGYVWHLTRRRSDGAPSDETSTADPGETTRRTLEEPSTGANPGEAHGSDGAPARTTGRVAMTDELAFKPGTITITAGDAVRWENDGTLTFTVTAYEEAIPAGADYFASGGFDSEETARAAYPDGGIASGGTYTHTFETPGTYEYFCVPQEGADMTGTIEVRERYTPGHE